MSQPTSPYTAGSTAPPRSEDARLHTLEYASRDAAMIQLSKTRACILQGDGLGMHEAAERPSPPSTIAL